MTHAYREKNRAGALTLAHESIVKLEDRMERNLRVRKQALTTINKNLKEAFYWFLAARCSFTEYLRNKQWTVRENLTEADLATKPEDAVISRDSDVLVYGTISTIWRPISRGRCLVYDVPNVLATLNISKIQLTVLGVVSKNDYNSNIYSFGCITNSGIIISLEGNDAPAMVESVLDSQPSRY
ncbi:hypothetical protein BG011_007769 [Mortierella polycephala]|uniref:Uncharacterized protein n=1 Tax=Mortierella polycephala TaxID=41804 RepID=A0A9P6U8N4_9FUNG|nr:hypothetical protein BG011_007769 [Mortierella polycephala]